MDCVMGVPILPKLPEFPGGRDGYRLAIDLRSKLSLVTAEYRPREGDANLSDSVREQAGFEPCPFESARSYSSIGFSSRTCPNSRRRRYDSGSAGRVHSTANGRTRRSPTVVPVL